MPDFRVWDELNSEESMAKMFTAASAYGAAIAYAEEDIDGRCDGLYTDDGRELQSLRNGQPLSVRDESGGLHRFLVGIVEFEPRFDAVSADAYERAAREAGGVTKEDGDA